METTIRPRYLTCAETAKLVRKALAKAHPGVKFRVRSDTYSMGASIYIHWIDGPTSKEADATVAPFSGARFDGMLDLKHSCSSWLMPDGSASFGRSAGTEGSRGTHAGYDHTRPHPEAEAVHFGADYVFTDREHSESLYARALNATCKKWGVDPVEARMETRESYHFKGVQTGHLKADKHVPNACEYLAILVYRELSEISQ